MPRVCFQLQVRPDRIDEYRERHTAVWPEMREALAATGWHNYSLLFFQDLEGRRADEGLLQLDEIFHLD